MSTVLVAGGRLAHDLDGGRCHVVLAGGAVRAVGPGDGPAGHPVVDADGLIVAPGFVDLQINGGYGIDLVSDPRGMWELGRRLPATGVTAFQPTIVSSAAATRDLALAALGDRPAAYAGAEPIGLHFEGPVLNPARRGAHDAAQLRPADPEVTAGWCRDVGVTMVTLAPELPGATELIGELVRRGVTVALGHTEATAADTDRAVAAGATVVTHLFNAMAPLHHREPGPVGVAMTEPALTAGVIVDGVHLDPLVVGVVWRALGPDRLALVTDAVAAMGGTAGAHRLGGARLIADDGAVRDAAGVLAGSTLTMDQAIRNLVDWTGCSVADAVRCASTTPAVAVGLPGRGRVAPGAVADLVLLDAGLEVALTICRGRVTHVAPEAIDRVPPVLIDGGG